MVHLKEKQYYIDLYDKFTIQRCRSIEATHDSLDDAINEEMDNPPSEEEILRARKAAKEMYLYFTTGEEYRNKDKTINEWVERDRELDLRVERAEEPQLVRCKTCGSKMFCSSKDILSSEEKVQFFFDCPNGCLPRRLLYEDGSEHVFKPTLCPKCEHEMTRDSEKLDDNIVTTTYTCTHCNHAYDDVLDLTPTEEPDDPEYEKDKARFCLSPEKGGDYIQWTHNLKMLTESMEKSKEREEKKEVYDQVKALKKLTVPQLKAHLLELFDKEGYSNLVFEKPDMGRIVSIEFTVEEMETDNERVSEKKLKKLIEEHLKETNWRLMSDGISYRLGMLSGRVRIYEDQDDLAKLIEKNK